ncbi:MAG: hypothetical protein HC902_12910 [Calothrix sp. SM1_5_4]|nr:hypothetical protein [Calothrix sp. SM1_5_4]
MTMTDRWIGIDILRFISFQAILAFHLTYALWADLGYTNYVVGDNPWMAPFEVYSRALVFSGFSVLFLSFFLFGLRAKERPSLKRRYLPVWITAFF